MIDFANPGILSAEQDRQHMPDFEEFIILLHRHPELIEQLRQIAERGLVQQQSKSDLKYDE